MIPRQRDPIARNNFGVRHMILFAAAQVSVRQAASVFLGWEIDQRYHSTGVTTEAQAKTWQADARKVLDALQGV